MKIDEGIYYGEIFKGFKLNNDKLEKINLCININFQSIHYTQPLFGFEYLNKENINKNDLIELKQKFDKEFEVQSLSNENFAVYIIDSKWTESILNLGSTWENLIDLRFGGKKSEIKESMKLIIEKMITLIDKF